MVRVGSRSVVLVKVYIFVTRSASIKGATVGICCGT